MLQRNFTEYIILLPVLDLSVMAVNKLMCVCIYDIIFIVSTGHLQSFPRNHKGKCSVLA